MSGFYYNHDGSVHKIIVDGTTEQELRESFENALTLLPAPKLNKMQEWLYGDRLRSLPREKQQELIEKRCGSGNTTGQALAQIAEAIKNPNKPIKLVTYEGDTSGMSMVGKQYRDVVKSLVEKLDLKFMVMRTIENTLTFEI